MARLKPDPTGVWHFCMFPPFPCFFHGLIGEAGNCGFWLYLELADVRLPLPKSPSILTMWCESIVLVGS
jgi:hypothetical protein